MDPSASQQKRQPDAQPSHLQPVHVPGIPATLPVGQHQGLTIPVCGAALPLPFNPLYQSSYGHPQPAYMLFQMPLAHQPHLVAVGPMQAQLAYQALGHNEQQYPGHHRPAELRAVPWQAGLQPVFPPPSPTPSMLHGAAILAPHIPSRKPLKPEPVFEPPEETTQASNTDSADEVIIFHPFFWRSVAKGVVLS